MGLAILFFLGALGLTVLVIKLCGKLIGAAFKLVKYIFWGIIALLTWPFRALFRLVRERLF